MEKQNQDQQERRRSIVRKAVNKFDAERVDKVTIRLPKGTKDRVAALGRSVNSYAIEAVEEKLKRDEKTAARKPEKDPGSDKTLEKNVKIR